jgi:outer membrane murein-binding lipoprotein Lpp
VVEGNASLSPEGGIVSFAEKDGFVCGSIGSSKTDTISAKIAEYEGRIKELQKQRDAALKQMKQIENELSRAKQEATEAIECKIAREKDLRIVLQNYQKLQSKCEDTVARVELLEAAAAKRHEEMEAEAAKRHEEITKKIIWISPLVRMRKLQKNQANHGAKDYVPFTIARKDLPGQ